jgi:hypothetical protein
VLIDYPSRHWLVHEDVAGAYLAYYAQTSKARQISPFHASRGAILPRRRGGSLFYAFGLLRGGWYFWRVGAPGAF